MNLQSIDIPLTIPDLWQQEAVRSIQAGKDVIVDAPTGAGKTYIFELLVESRKIHGQLVYTVPTRALANDKLLEWKKKGWNVGIATGDIAENIDAPVIVATLETQKARLLDRNHPSLIVIDEYQMINDASRGSNYEMVIAIAPEETQLLLLSGSVKNPQDVVDWMNRNGRNTQLISHKERPVPLEQIYLDSLPDRAPKSIYGYWPRFIYRALLMSLDPILIFAPQRKDSERIARQIASSLPEDDPLELTPEQKRIAGDKLAKLLKTRVAYHHSGLSYKQRAGIIEPLAKAGQLRVVVATTGLGAGINFSMRSVIVTEREYRQQDQVSQVRSDELLQMFGRAGRRGLDDRGYVLVLPNKPRMEDAAPIQLKRTSKLDWPTLLRLMHQATQHQSDPAITAQAFSDSLFSLEPVHLGFEQAPKPTTDSKIADSASKPKSQSKVIEIQNRKGNWERRKGPHHVRMEDTWALHKSKWKRSHKVAQILSKFEFGTTCKISKKNERFYGKEWPIAQFPKSEGQKLVTINKQFRKRMLHFASKTESAKIRSMPKNLSLESLEKQARSWIPKITGGGALDELQDRNGTIVARIDMRKAIVTARQESEGNYLLNAPEREIDNAYQHFDFKTSTSRTTNSKQTIVSIWKSLGLIETDGTPTRRGIIFSFFNHGEGLAVSAALEKKDYPIESLVWDLANLRTGHRFDHIIDSGSQFSYICRETYGSVSYQGYLKRGLPIEYGEGGSELVQQVSSDSRAKHNLVGEEVSTGDIERVILEWKSILRQILNAPPYPWDRWLELQAHIRENHHLTERSFSLLELPPLTSKQTSRKPIPFRLGKR